MRTLQSRKHPSIKFKVIKHIMTSNFWEFYVTDLPNEEGIGNALVQGVEIEWGSFDYNEIKPYIISETDMIDEITPCIGYDWVE